MALPDESSILPHAMGSKSNLALLVPASALGLAVLYTLVNWALMGILDKDVADLWLPLASAAILTMAVILPRLRLWTGVERKYLLLAQTVAAFVFVALPVTIAQDCLYNMSGTLVRIADAQEIARRPDARYFKAERICVDGDRVAADSVFEDGDDDQVLHVTLYVAVPLCGRGDLWLGLIYRHDIDERLAQAEKDAQYRAFLKRTDAQLATFDPMRATYLERLRTSGERKGLRNAILKADPRAVPAIVMARAGDFARRAGNGPLWLALSLVLGAALWILFVALSPVNTQPAEAAGDGQASAWQALFVPTRKNYGLPVLIDINVAVFIAMALSGAGVMSVQSDELIAWGGNYGPALHGLGWLRLFTSQFEHAGAIHILNNMGGLLSAALFLMPAMRNAGLILAYLLCGLGGSLASAWVDPATVSVGASGAIFGLYGIALVLVVLGDWRLSEGRKTILLEAAVFVVINLVLGWMTPGIDNAAHAGGFGVGLALGAIVYAAGRKAA